MAYLDDEYIWRFADESEYHSFIISSAYTEPFVGAYPEFGDVTEDDIIVKYTRDAQKERE